MMGERIVRISLLGLLSLCLLWNTVSSRCPTRCVCPGNNVYCHYTGLMAIPQVIPFNTSRLFLHGNDLMYVRNDSFVGLSDLVHLFLHSNRITGVEVGSFAGLRNLQRLYLNYNKLTTLPRNVFKDLNNLQYLYLYSNNIVALDEFLFQDLHKLKSLYLDDNKLTCLQPDTFTGLSNLQTLHLYGNQIQFLSERTFHNLANLRILHLYSNEISYISENVFRGLSELFDIRLDSNLLESLPEGLFRGLHKLEYLYINNNLITTLTGTIFDDLDNLYFLSMHFNPFRCDCALRRLRHWLHERRAGLFLYGTMKCETPERLENKDILSIILDDLTCYPIPVFYTPIKTIHAHPGDRVALDCDVIGEPIPSTYWITPNGSIVRSQLEQQESCLDSSTLQIEYGDLVIQSARSADEGSYVCVATNSEGTSLGYRMLKVIDDTKSEATTYEPTTELSPTNEASTTKAAKAPEDAHGCELFRGLYYHLSLFCGL